MPMTYITRQIWWLGVSISGCFLHICHSLEPFCSIETNGWETSWAGVTGLADSVWAQCCQYGGQTAELGYFWPCFDPQKLRKTGAPRLSLWTLIWRRGLRGTCAAVWQFFCWQHCLGWKLWATLSGMRYCMLLIHAYLYTVPCCILLNVSIFIRSPCGTRTDKWWETKCQHYIYATCYVN